MALAACEIRHGGRSDGYYTIKDFAEDIGINRKTLSNWIHVYRDILLKCDIKTPTNQDWTNAQKVERILRSDRTVENLEANTPRSLTPYRKEIPSENIKKMFNDIASGDEEVLKFERVYRAVLHNNGVLKELDLSRCNEKKLVRVMELLDQSSDLINDYLTENVATA